MYHVSAQGVDERMINVHYYYYYMMVTTGFTFSVEPHMVVFKIALLDLLRHFAVLRTLHLGEAAGVRDLFVQFLAPVVAQKLVQLGDLTHRVLEHKVNVNDKTEW